MGAMNQMAHEPSSNGDKKTDSRKADDSANNGLIILDVNSGDAKDFGDYCRIC
jgi:hypothetical protein